MTWDTLAVTKTVPTGTSLSVTAKVGTQQADGSILWQLAVIDSEGMMKDQFGNPIIGQYLQYFITMTTTDATKTPRLDDISFTWV
jgi:hypothetical protein